MGEQGLRKLKKAVKQSHNPKSRIEYLRKAVDAAMEANPAKALKLIEEANAETEKLDDAEFERLVNTLYMSKCLLLMDNLKEAQNVISEGMKQPAVRERPRLNFLYTMELVNILEHRGDYAEALMVMNEKLPPFDELDSDEDRMNLMSKKGHILLHKGMLAESEEVLTRGLALAAATEAHAMKLDFFVCLGILHVQRGNADEAIRYYRLALSMVQSKDKRRVGTGWLYNNAAVPYFHQGDFAMAEEMLRKALQIFEYTNYRHGIASVTLNLGGVCLQRGEISAALPMLFRAYSLTKEIGLVHAAIETGNNIGIALTNAGDYAGAERYLTETLALAQQHDFRSLEGAVLNSFGKLYGEKGDFELAIEHFGNALLSARAAGDARSEGIAQINIAQAWQRLGQNGRALPYFFFAMNSFLGTGDKFHRTICYCGISEAFLALGNHAAARDNAAHARTLAEEIGNSPVLKKKVEETFALLLETTGETALALAHYKTAAQAGDENKPKELVEKVVSVMMGQQQEESQKTTSQLEEKIRALELEVEALKGNLREQALKNVQQQEALESAAGLLNGELMRRKTASPAKLRQAISVLKSADDKHSVWHAFEQELERQSPNFLKRLMDAYPALSRAEIRICSLLAIQMSSKNVAAMLYLDKKTIDKHRQNIRRKMRIPSNLDLALHVAKFREQTS